MPKPDKATEQATVLLQCPLITKELLEREGMCCSKHTCFSLIVEAVRKEKPSTDGRWSPSVCSMQPSLQEDKALLQSLSFHGCLMKQQWTRKSSEAAPESLSAPVRPSTSQILRRTL